MILANATPKDYTLIIYSKAEIDALLSAEQARLQLLLNFKAPTASIGAPAGLATLDGTGRHSVVEIPFADHLEAADPLEADKVMSPLRVSQLIAAGQFLSQAVADATYGDLKSDGTRAMTAAYNPQNSKDIATVEYVLSHAGGTAHNFVVDTRSQMLNLTNIKATDMCFVVAELDPLDNGQFIAKIDDPQGLSDWAENTQQIAWGHIIGDVRNQTDLLPMIQLLDHITLTQDIDLDTLLATANSALQVHQDITGKVDIVVGKELSTNDYTTADKDLVGTALQTHQDITGKVDVVVDMGLSSNDYTDVDKLKLDNLVVGTTTFLDHGTIPPLDTDGKDGDVYFEYEETVKNNEYASVTFGGNAGNVFSVLDSNGTTVFSFTPDLTTGLTTGLNPTNVGLVCFEVDGLDYYLDITNVESDMPMNLAGVTPLTMALLSASTPTKVFDTTHSGDYKTFIKTNGTWIEQTTLGATEVDKMIELSHKEYSLTVHLDTAGNKPTHTECVTAFKTLPNHDFSNDDQFYLLSDNQAKLNFVKYLSNGSTLETDSTYQFWVEEMALSAGSPTNAPIAILETFTIGDANVEEITVSIAGEDLSIGSNSQAQERLHYKIDVNGTEILPRSLSVVGGNILLETYYGIISTDTVKVTYDGLGETTGSNTGKLVAFIPQLVSNTVTTPMTAFTNILLYGGPQYEKTLFINFDSAVANNNDRNGWTVTEVTGGKNMTVSGTAGNAQQMQLTLVDAMSAGDYIVEYDGSGGMENDAGISLRPVPATTVTYTP